MPKLRIAMYKAKYGDWTDKLIDWFTGGGGYSHCELVINANRTIGSHIAVGGVSYFYYDDIYTNQRWDIFELDSMDRVAIAYAEKQLGKKYDLVGLVLNFLLPVFSIKGKDNGKWWCSELVMAAINKQLPSGYPTQVSPNDIIQILTSMDLYLQSNGGGAFFTPVYSAKIRYLKGDMYGRSSNKR